MKVYSPSVLAVHAAAYAVRVFVLHTAFCLTCLFKSNPMGECTNSMTNQQPHQQCCLCSQGYCWENTIHSLDSASTERRASLHLFWPLNVRAHTRRVADHTHTYTERSILRWGQPNPKHCHPSMCKHVPRASHASRPSPLSVPPCPISHKFHS